MSAKLKLGGAVLALLLVLLPSISPVALQTTQGSESVVVEYAVPPLTAEQKALVEHLAGKYRQPEEKVETIVRTAFSEGAKADISPLLILAIIEKESSFRSDAVSSYGAQGLMQVVPRYHQDKLPETGKKQALFEPVTNIRVGTQILAEYLQAKQGNLREALKKYSGNAREYFRKVKGFKDDLREVADKAEEV